MGPARRPPRQAANLLCLLAGRRRAAGRISPAARGLAALALLLAVSPLWAGQQPSAWDDIWRSETSARGLHVVGRAATKMTRENHVKEAVASVVAANGKARLDYQADHHSWTLIDDGERLIRLSPRKRQATVLPRPQLVTDRPLAERNYVCKVAGEARVADRPTRMIEVAPRGGGRVTWRLWLDRENDFALKRERYNAEGKLTSGTEYLEVRFGGEVPPGAFSIPAGWETVDQDGPPARLSLPELSRQLGFPVALPRYLPAGYVLQGSYVQTRGRRRHQVAELRYTDGLRVLTISQRPRGREGPGAEEGPGREREERGRHRRGRGEGRRGGGFGPPTGDRVTLVDRGSEKALRYHGDRLVVVVVGDLPSNELLRIATGVE